MTDYLKSFVKVETEIKTLQKELSIEKDRVAPLEAKLENSAMTAQYVGTLFAIQKGWKKADAQSLPMLSRVLNMQMVLIFIPLPSRKMVGSSVINLICSERLL